MPTISNSAAIDANDLARIFDHQTTAIVLLDANGRVRFLNPAAENLLEISKTQATGAPLSQFVISDADGLGQWFEYPRRATTTRQATLWLRNGKQTSSDCTLTPIADTNEALLEFSQLTELLRLHRDDESAMTSKTSQELVRGFAHEIRNPLGGIRGAAQLLSRELEDPGEMEYTSVIINEVDRLSRLVDRMVGPRQQPQFAPANIHRLLEQVTRVLEAEAHERISIVRDYDPSLPPVRCDAAQLQQAFLNVMLNARQALEHTDQATITVSTRSVRQFTIGATRHRLALHVIIADNGPGISQDLMQRMFYPMISGRADGTGLGLSITQTIVAAHQGLLECTSQPGETRFHFYLPLELDP